MANRPVIEYYFTVISSWSYIGSRRIRALAEQHNARIVYKPVDLMHVFSVSGGLPVGERAPQRQAYRLLEIERWTRRNNLPMNKHPKNRPNPSLAHRVLLAAISESGHDSRSVHDFVLRCQDTVWVDDGDIADPATIIENANQSGLDGVRLLERAEKDEDLSKQEQALTQEAIDKQYFGAPTYVYRGEPFWGQDRLDMLDEMIRSDREPISFP